MIWQTFHAWATTTTKARGRCRDLGRLPATHSRSCPSSPSLPPRTKELLCLTLQTTALMTGGTKARGASSTFLSSLCRGERAAAGGTTAEGPGSHHRTFAHAVPAGEQNAERLPQRLPCPPLLPPDSHPHPAAFCPPFPASLQFPKISYNLLIQPIYVRPSPSLLSTASLHALGVQTPA